jgi:hypothetical protein
VESFGHIFKIQKPHVLLSPYSHHAIKLEALGKTGEGKYWPQKDLAGIGFGEVNKKVENALVGVNTENCATIILLESLDWNSKSESELNLYFPPKKIVEQMKTNDFYGNEEFESSSEDTEKDTESFQVSQVSQVKTTPKGSENSVGNLGSSGSQIDFNQSDFNPEIIMDNLSPDNESTEALEISQNDLMNNSQSDSQSLSVSPKSDLEYFNIFGIPGLHLLLENGNRSGMMFQEHIIEKSIVQISEISVFLLSLSSLIVAFFVLLIPLFITSFFILLTE